MIFSGDFVCVAQYPKQWCTLKASFSFPQKSASLLVMSRVSKVKEICAHSKDAVYCSVALFNPSLLIMSWERRKDTEWEEDKGAEAFKDEFCGFVEINDSGFHYSVCTCSQLINFQTISFAIKKLWKQEYWFSLLFYLDMIVLLI